MATLHRWVKLATSAIVAKALAACQLVDPANALTSGGPEKADAAGDATSRVDSETADAGRDAEDARDAPGSTSCDANVATDPMNCGRCGRSCFGGTCAGGMCSPVVLMQAAIGGLAYHDGVVYYTLAADAGGVVSHVLDGGAELPIVRGIGPSGPITIASSYAVWTALGDGGVAVYRAELDGGDPTRLTRTGLVDQVTCIAANSTNVFWPNLGASEVDHAPLLTPGTPSKFEPLGSVTPLDLAANDSFLVVAGSETVHQATLSDGAESSILGLNGTAWVALNDTYAYYVSNDAIFAVRAGDGTGAVQIGTTALESNPQINGLVADNQGVYWVTNGATEIEGCDDPLCKGKQKVIAKGLAPIQQYIFALGPDSFFFLNPSSNYLYRLAR